MANTLLEFHAFSLLHFLLLAVLVLLSSQSKIANTRITLPAGETIVSIFAQVTVWCTNSNNNSSMEAEQETPEVRHPRVDQPAAHLPRRNGNRLCLVLAKLFARDRRPGVRKCTAKGA